MTQGKDLLWELTQRGLVHQSTDAAALEDLFDKKGSFYIGFDPTYHDLHLGHYSTIAFMKRLQSFGLQPVVLIGGATAMIGDPSGKSVERVLLDVQQVSHNKEEIRKLFGRFLQNFTLVDNFEWFSKMDLFTFLRDVAKHFRMGVMLSRDSVKSRLESEEGISFTEFSYQILQAYDFVHLARNHSVTLQCGGSDQWGNMISGVEFGSKFGLKLQALTMPLIVGSDGRKFGKSEKGQSLWLSDFQKGPYQMYQYLLNIPDEMIETLLKRLTFLSLEEIQELVSSDLHPNLKKEKLASCVTEDIFGSESLIMAKKITGILLPGSKEIPDQKEDFEALLLAVPHLCRRIEKIDLGQKISDLFVKLGLFASKGEVSRLIEQKGLFLNGKNISDNAKIFTEEDLILGSYALVSKGKKEKTLLFLA